MADNTKKKPEAMNPPAVKKRASSRQNVVTKKLKKPLRICGKVQSKGYPITVSQKRAAALAVKGYV